MTRRMAKLYPGGGELQIAVTLTGLGEPCFLDVERPLGIRRVGQPLLRQIEIIENPKLGIAKVPLDLEFPQRRWCNKCDRAGVIMAALRKAFVQYANRFGRLDAELPLVHERLENGRCDGQFFQDIYYFFAEASSGFGRPKTAESQVE